MQKEIEDNSLETHKRISDGDEKQISKRESIQLVVIGALISVSMISILGFLALVL